MTLSLTTEQVDFFQTNGYLLIPDFLSMGTVEAMKSRMSELLRNIKIDEHRTIFSTGENQTSNADDYFLGSGDKIRYFWEENAWNAQGELVNAAEKCVNKVGHALQDLDDVFRAVSYDCRIGDICRDLGNKRPLNVQSMYIFKQPRIGGDVCPHQDGSYLFTTPQSVIGFWWALDLCDKENGCLWAVPGSHKQGVLRHYRRVKDPNAATKTEYFPAEKENFDLSEAIPLEVSPGTLVIIHNSLVHYSAKNTSERPRHAYSIHVVDSSDGIVYDEDNWLQRTGSAIPFQVIPSSMDEKKTEIRV